MSMECRGDWTPYGQESQKQVKSVSLKLAGDGRLICKVRSQKYSAPWQLTNLAPNLPADVWVWCVSVRFPQSIHIPNKPKQVMDLTL